LSSLHRRLALSNHPAARGARAIYRFLRNFSLPAPRWIFGPILVAYLFSREVYYFLIRVFVCEPFFKAYCAKYGRNVHTGVFVHWIQGRGQLIVGDNVIVDGKCSFIFALRYTEQPTLRVGNNVVIGHNCTFTVGREITIGNNVMIAGNVEMFDSPGHPTDPALRLAGSAALPEDVKPIRIEDNVWIGGSAIIYPGLTVGEGSIVAKGAIVMNNVPPNVIVAGSPARQIARIGHAGVNLIQKEHAERDLEVLNEILCRFLNLESIVEYQDIYEAGLTSIMALPLLAEIEDTFELTIPDADFLDARTPRSLARLIQQLRMLSS
jgi:acetyltransferase-like isoleucine patch superfamily enzyme/acyl carrier protein